MKAFVLLGLNPHTNVSEIIAIVNPTAARTLEDAAKMLSGELVKTWAANGKEPEYPFVCWGNFQPSSDTAKTIAASERGDCRDPLSGGFIGKGPSNEQLETRLRQFACFALIQRACVTFVI